MVSILLVVTIGYFLGAIPFGVLVSKYFRGFDLRTKGSGNMGSTNAFRVLGWKLGLLVQVLDIAKGVGAVLIATYLFNGLPFANATPFQDITVFRFFAGFAAVIGHCYTIFAGWKGGKGISTTLGMLVAIAPIEVAVAVGIFLLVVFASGYISLGSIMASLAFPTTMFVRHNFFGVEITGYHTAIFFAIGLAVFLVYRHRANIVRLLAKTENKFEKLHILRFGKA
ncbi:MAG TPA: glycerol-3-phosphate 1-O-acyltransferase PlsY [Candidatus Kapabacteria bacterium]